LTAYDGGGGGGGGGGNDDNDGDDLSHQISKEIHSIKIADKVNTHNPISKHPEFSCNWKNFKENIPFLQITSKGSCVSQMFTSLAIILLAAHSNAAHYPCSNSCHSSRG
jgi:hypothetical protein